MSVDADEIVAPLLLDYATASRDFLLSAPPTKISNVVATCSLDNARLDPSEIAHRLPGILVDPKKFAAGTQRTEEAVALIFASGRLVCTGAASVRASQQAALDVARLLLGAGYLVRCINFTVQNIVSFASAGFAVDIAAIARACPTDVQYDKDRFPGARFRFRAMRIVITFFVSGPVIIAGARDERDARVCWAWFYTHVLRRFRIADGERPLTSAAYRAETRRRTDSTDADLRAIRARRADVAPRDDDDDERARDALADAIVDTSIEALLAGALADTERALAAADGDDDDDDAWARVPDLASHEYARELAEARRRLDRERGTDGDASEFARHVDDDDDDDDDDNAPRKRARV